MDLRELLGESSGRNKPCTISHVGQVARLKEFGDRFSRGCPFKVGDIVTARRDATYKNAGQPHLVLEVEPLPRNLEADSASQSYGAVHDMRVASFYGEAIAIHAVESVYFEAYSEEHSKTDPERELSDASA